MLYNSTLSVCWFRDFCSYYTVQDRLKHILCEGLYISVDIHQDILTLPYVLLVCIVDYTHLRLHGITLYLKCFIL